jgi:hypothetical protein
VSGANVSVIGHENGQVRLRVVAGTKATTLEEHVHHFTLPDCHVYTDEYDSYNGIERSRSTMMTTASAKSTSIPLKACGRAYATSCVPFAVFTRNISQAMSRYTNAGST